MFNMEGRCSFCSQQILGGVMLQDTAIAACMVDPVIEAKLKVSQPEAPLALWSQHTDQVHITAVSGEANV